MSKDKKPKLVKPSKDFPLTPSPIGYWKKVIDKKDHYFGQRWCSPEEALEDYEQRKDSIEAGEPQLAKREAVSLKDALEKYLEWQLSRVTGPRQLSMRTYRDSKDECEYILRKLPSRTAIHNLSPKHFQTLERSYKGEPTTIRNKMARAKAAFNWIEAEYHIRLNFGHSFKLPSVAKIRERVGHVKVKRGKFKPEEVKLLIEHAKNPQIKAMIWLGINCGFGNSDVGKLKLGTLLQRFEDGWIEYPRPKTGVARAAKLWPETIAALKLVIGRRTQPDQLVFLTKYGNPWSTDSKASAISSEIRKIREAIAKAGHPFNDQLGFYDLRRAFATFGSSAEDKQAVSFIMGHATADMTEVYEQGMLDSRLLKVSNAVRDWLFGTSKAGEYFTR